MDGEDSADLRCVLCIDDGPSYRRAFDRAAAMEIMIDEAEDYDMKIFLAFQSAAQ